MTRETKVSGIRQKTHMGIDKIMDRAELMREGGKEAMIRLKEKATMMKESVNGYIQKNPKKSIAIAAGTGAIVGAMIAAAKMRRRAD